MSVLSFLAVIALVALAAQLVRAGSIVRFMLVLFLIANFIL